MTFRTIAFAALFAAVPLTGALADRSPNDEERQIIADVLRDHGITGYGDVEWDDNQWEIDDAVGPDGKKMDVTLDANFMMTNSQDD